MYIIYIFKENNAKFIQHYFKNVMKKLYTKCKDKCDIKVFIFNSYQTMTSQTIPNYLSLYFGSMLSLLDIYKAFKHALGLLNCINYPL